MIQTLDLTSVKNKLRDLFAARVKHVIWDETLYQVWSPVWDAVRDPLVARMHPITLEIRHEIAEGFRRLFHPRASTRAEAFGR